MIRKTQKQKNIKPNKEHSVVVKMTETMGRGVFTTKDIPKNTILLVHPIIISDIDGNSFDRFTYRYSQHQTAIALGIGTLVNHSKNPNCEAVLDEDNYVIEFKTIKKIKKGQQLFVDYGYDPLAN